MSGGVSGNEGVAASSGQGLADIQKLLLEMSFPPDVSIIQRAQDAIGCVRECMLIIRLSPLGYMLQKTAVHQTLSDEIM